MMSGVCPRHPDRPPHPLFGYYGEPTPPWPRILVIGREPNADHCMNDEAGPWLGEPATNGRTAFWTWSHRAISRAAKIKGIDL